MKFFTTLFIVFFHLSSACSAQAVIYLNQIGFDSQGPKIAVIGVDEQLPGNTVFSIINTENNKTEFTGTLGKPQKINEWVPIGTYYQADFSLLRKTGKYSLRIVVNGKPSTSYPFEIEDNALAKLTISSIIHYYHKQRANTPAELAADTHMHMMAATKQLISGAAGATRQAM